MPTSTVIIHGWSDCSASFAGLKKYLQHKRIGDVKSIYYGDYESREDNITFDDIADGLNDEFRRLGFIDEEGCAKPGVSMNVVVHSTGGLVIRHWMWRYYLRDGCRHDVCPVKRIVMLAPANFGSPLAHRGRSFLGSLVKGRWKVGDLWEVGRNLLEGLELASPFQWSLAHGDLLCSDALYGRDRTQVTVLVGADDYDGLRGWVNKAGTDGTVVIAGTSLDSLKLTLDCCKPAKANGEYEPYAWSQAKPVDDFAFGVLPGLDHGTIVSDIENGDRGVIGPYIARALSTRSAAEFHDFQGDLEAATAHTYRTTGKKAYQQFIVRAVDDFDRPIRDYTIEFYILRASRKTDGVVGGAGVRGAERDLTDKANELMTGEFHPHSADPSCRRFLVCPADVKALMKLAKERLGEDAVLSMRVFVPKIDGGIKYDVTRLQNIVLADTSDKKSPATPSFLFENTTTLLELRINRVCSYCTVDIQPKRR